MSLHGVESPPRTRTASLALIARVAPALRSLLTPRKSLVSFDLPAFTMSQTEQHASVTGGALSAHEAKTDEAKYGTHPTDVSTSTDVNTTQGDADSEGTSGTSTVVTTPRTAPTAGAQLTEAERLALEAEEQRNEQEYQVEQERLRQAAQDAGSISHTVTDITAIHIPRPAVLDGHGAAAATSGSGTESAQRRVGGIVQQAVSRLEGGTQASMTTSGINLALESSLRSSLGMPQLEQQQRPQQAPQPGPFAGSSQPPTPAVKHEKGGRSVDTASLGDRFFISSQQPRGPSNLGWVDQPLGQSREERELFSQFDAQGRPLHRTPPPHPSTERPTDLSHLAFAQSYGQQRPTEFVGGSHLTSQQQAIQSPPQAFPQQSFMHTAQGISPQFSMNLGQSVTGVQELSRFGFGLALTTYQSAIEGYAAGRDESLTHEQVVNFVNQLHKKHGSSPFEVKAQYPQHIYTLGSPLPVLPFTSDSTRSSTASLPQGGESTRAQFERIDSTTEHAGLTATQQSVLKAREKHDLDRYQQRLEDQQPKPQFGQFGAQGPFAIGMMQQTNQSYAGTPQAYQQPYQQPWANAPFLGSQPGGIQSSITSLGGVNLTELGSHPGGTQPPTYYSGSQGADVSVLNQSQFGALPMPYQFGQQQQFGSQVFGQQTPFVQQQPFIPMNLGQPPYAPGPQQQPPLPPQGPGGAGGFGGAPPPPPPPSGGGGVGGGQIPISGLHSSYLAMTPPHQLTTHMPKDSLKHVPKLKSLKPEDWETWLTLMTTYLMEYELEGHLRRDPVYSIFYLTKQQQALAEGAANSEKNLVPMGLPMPGFNPNDPQYRLARLKEYNEFCKTYLASVTAFSNCPEALSLTRHVVAPNTPAIIRILDQHIRPKTALDLQNALLKLSSMRMQKGESIDSVNNRLIGLISRIQQLGQTINDVQAKLYFITALQVPGSPYLGTRRDNLFSLTQNYAHAVSMAREYEQMDAFDKPKSGKSSSSTAEAYNADVKKKTNTQSKGDHTPGATCSYCKKTEHTADQCYKRKNDEARAAGSGNGGQTKGKPKGKPKAKSTDKAKKKCNYCDRTNHLEAECRDKQQGKPRASNRKKPPPTGLTAQSTSSSDDSDEFTSSRDAQGYGCEVVDDNDVEVFTPLAEAAKAEARTTESVSSSSSKPFVEMAIDTGANHTMVNAGVPLANVRDSDKLIRTAGGSLLKNTRMGVLTLSTNQGFNLTLPSVLQNNALVRNLASASAILKLPGMKYGIITDKSIDFFNTKDEMVMSAPEKNGLYLVRLRVGQPNASSRTIAEANLTHAEEAELLHQRCNHLGAAALAKLKKFGTVTDADKLPSMKQDLFKNCEICLRGKATKLPFKPSIQRALKADRPLQRINADVHGPVTPMSITGKSYVLVLVDEGTELKTVFIMAEKGESAERIKYQFTQWYNLFGRWPAELHTDRGGEFIAKSLTSFLTKHGVKATYSPPYEPESNGQAERANRTLVQHARLSIIQAKAPRKLWTYAIRAATYVHNRVHVNRHGRNPIQSFYGHARPPTISHLVKWGCDAYYTRHDATAVKSDKYGERGVLTAIVDYCENTGYYVLMETTGEHRTVESKHVRFDENSFRAMKLIRDSLQETEDAEEEDDEEFFGNITFKNEVEAIRQSQLEAEERERDEDAKRIARESVMQHDDEPLEIRAPVPRRNVNISLSDEESSPSPAPSPPSSPEFDSSVQPAKVKGQRLTEVERLQQLAAPIRFTSARERRPAASKATLAGRSTRPPSQYGKVDYGRDLGQAHAIEVLEREMTDAIFGGADPFEREAHFGAEDFEDLLSQIDRDREPVESDDDDDEDERKERTPPAAPARPARRGVQLYIPSAAKAAAAAAKRKKISAPSSLDLLVKAAAPRKRISMPSPAASAPAPAPAAQRKRISMPSPADRAAAEEEAERRENIRNAMESIPYNPNRGRINRNGEIITPGQRCVATTKKGTHCRSRTRDGSLCFNHRRSILGLKIAASEVGGRGLFATRDLPIGTEVSKYTGDVLSNEQQEEDEEIQKNKSRYIFGVTDDQIIDAARKNSALGRMLNDARGTGKRYNCQWVISSYGDTPSVRIVTTRRVRAGDELLIRYGADFWQKSLGLKMKGRAPAGAKARPLAPIREERRPKRGPLAHPVRPVRIVASDAEAHEAFDEETDPTTFKQAMSSKNRLHWLEAIKAEHQSIVDQGVYRKVDGLPRGAKLLTTKWVFKVKRDQNGKPVRFKARLVVRGFMQREGIDYNETFAPVMYYPHFRTILAIAMQLGYQIRVADVETAFLHAFVEEDLFISSPEGLEGLIKGTTLKLVKALYGLKQAPRVWNHRFVSGLQGLGWEPCVFSDKCVFKLMSKTQRVMILSIFVDDITYINHPDDQQEMDEQMTRLEQQFKIKRLGFATQILGMRITIAHDGKSLILDQEAYFTRVLSSVGFLNVKSADTPASGVKNLVTEQKIVHYSPLLDNQRHANSSSSSSIAGDTHPQVTVDNYRSLVGSLSYGANSTRPDIAFAVNQLSRKCASPDAEDVERLKRLLRYVAGSIDIGIKYSQHRDLKMVAYSDSDWAGDQADSKSCTGILLKIGDVGGAVYWSSKKQSVVALSSTEAEYIAASECGRDVEHLRRFLANLGIYQPYPTTMLIDNQTAIRMIVDEGNEARRKHIRVKFHYIRQLYEDGTIYPQWIKTADQQADILTKALSRQPFEKIRSLVMGV